MTTAWSCAERFFFEGHGSSRAVSSAEVIAALAAEGGSSAAITLRFAELFSAE